MEIREHKTPTHWNYFLALEQDVMHLSRYIEFTESNFSTHSIELSRILMASSSEVDVVAKALCRYINPKSKADRIFEYQEEIIGRYPSLFETEVEIPRFGLTFSPWANWNQKETRPPWSGAYNKVKHHRDSEFKMANLENALNAFSGLFVLLLFLYENDFKRGRISPLPTIITYSSWNGGDLSFGFRG